ncbi:leucine-rich repeat domain-containing protein [Bacillus timonensis]|nr:leucine-rich repeat domain-containing protein [Bacillus timonensis]
MRRMKWLNIMLVVTVLLSLFTPFASKGQAQASADTTILLKQPVQDGEAVNLSWITNVVLSDGDIEKYELVKNGEALPFEPTLNEEKVADDASRATRMYSYVDTEVEAGKAYTYQVVGYVNGEPVHQSLEVSIEVTSQQQEVSSNNQEVKEGTQATETVTTTEDVVSIPDVNLEQAIRDALNIQDGQLTKQDLAGLYSLYVSGFGIQSLEGLQYATNLTDLSVWDNQIKDITPIKSLTNLIYLDLESNMIQDISALSDLINLETLWISNNPISDISSVANLSLLSVLYADTTSISDISVLKKLMNLEYVSLFNIDTLDISEGSVALDIIYELEARGVFVDYNNYYEEPSSYIEIFVDSVGQHSTDIAWYYEGSYTVDFYAIYVNGEFYGEAHNGQTWYHVDGLEAGTEYEIIVEAYFTDSEFVEASGIFVTTSSSNSEPTGDMVNFVDVNLEAAVRDQLYIYDRPIYVSDMESLTSLYAGYYGIESLEGLQYAVNLMDLSVYGNSISDLTPIQNLTQLSYLDLDDNQISDLTPIANLTNLSMLWITYNPITDLNPLANLQALTDVFISGTDISDITVLESLTSLQFVVLFNNASLDLSEGSAAMQVINNLQNRNVYVEYGAYEEYPIEYIELYTNGVTETSITVSWDVYSDYEIDSYDLYLDGVLHENVSNIEHTYTFSGLQHSTEYELAVHALNSLGEVMIESSPIFVTTWEPPTGDLVTFSDGQLELAVRDQLSIYNRDIYESDMKRLTFLFAAYYDIQSLSGLEYAINLEDLIIFNNQVSDLSPISGLTNLRYIDMEENQISDISTLSQLTNLTGLWMSNNPISDLTVLSHLNQLEVLSVNNTHIEDISVLLQLPLLQYVALYQNENLDLSEGSAAMQVVDTLISNGVYVDYEGYINPDHTVDIYVNNVSETTVDIEWNYFGAGEPISYHIYVDGNFIDEVPASQNFYTLEGLNPGQEYSISIEAIDYEYFIIGYGYTYVMTSDTPSGEVVVFEDINLEEAVRNELGIYNRDLLASDMAKLTWLSAAYMNISSLSGLEFATNLEGLVVFGNTITDLQPLEQLTELVHLDVESNQISDISFLVNMKNLQTLWIDDNPIEDISALQHMTSLVNLYLDRTLISDISVLVGLTALEYVSLYGNPNLDLTEGSLGWSVIETLTNRGVHVDYFGYEEGLYIYESFANENTLEVYWSYLENVNYYAVYLNGVLYGEVSAEETWYMFNDLQPLTEYEVTIEAYGFEGELVDSASAILTTWDVPSGEVVVIPDANLKEAIRLQLRLSDREILTSDMERLEYFGAAGMNITDLTGLEYAVNLSDLSLFDNQISDLTAIQHLTNLWYLDLENNHISDISALAGLTNLETLWLDRNPLSDISILGNLVNLRTLYLHETLITDISVLEELMNLEYVSLSNISTLDLSEGSAAMQTVQVLQDRGVYVELEAYEEEPMYDIELTVNEVTDTSISFSWEFLGDSSLVNKYFLVLNGELLAELPADVNSYIAEGLTAGTEYELFVVAFDAEEMLLGYNHMYVMTEDAPQPTLSGWVVIEGKTYYYNPQTGQPVTGWLELEGKKYYFAASGVMQTGWVTIASQTYYFDPANGEMKTGWITVNGKTFYLNTIGVKQVGWVTVDGKTYYVDAVNGKQVGWIVVNQQSFYLDANGVKQVGWVTVEGKTYYVDAVNGKQAGWIVVNQQSFYLDANGVKQVGWVTVNNKKYYIDAVNGKQIGWMKLNNIWYFLNQSGEMQTGWVTDNGSTYYLDPTTGAMQTGWITVNGQSFYLSSTGVKQVGWTTINGKIFYLDATYGKQTGWITVNGQTFYLDVTGEKKTNWVSVDGKWYFINSNSGMIKSTWMQSSNKWYFFDETGVMKTGWMKWSSKWYYLDANGAMKTGWVQSGGKWYYLNAGGEMQFGWLKSGSSWYYLDGSGEMKTGWLLSSGKWYYMSGTGAMVSGWKEINHKWYFFYSGGNMAYSTVISGYRLGSDGAWIR